MLFQFVIKYLYFILTGVVTNKYNTVKSKSRYPTKMIKRPKSEKKKQNSSKLNSHQEKEDSQEDSNLKTVSDSKSFKLGKRKEDNTELQYDITPKKFTNTKKRMDKYA